MCEFHFVRAIQKNQNRTKWGLPVASKVENPNAPNPYNGKTPLHLATENHHTETAKALFLILANKLTTSSAPELILNTMTK